MTLRITALNDNTASMGNYLAEWGLCHCTDLPAISLLAQEFRGNYLFIKAGTQIELP